MSGTVVIGGGLAGLAAAAALAQRGQSVTLVEARRRLGGRAGSVLDPHTGWLVDTGQHVLLGCCTNLLHFCRVVGLEKWLQWHDRLFFVSAPVRGRGRVTVFRAAPLPAPLHLLPALWRSHFLDGRAKRAVLRGLVALAGAGPEQWERPFADWLRERGQPALAVNRFWRVILVSALSERLERISVRYARQVFLQGFLAHRRAWQMVVPTVPLGELFGQRVLEWLRGRRVDVRLGTHARRLLEKDGRATGVELSDGRVLEAAHFVLAVPHSVAAKVAAPTVRQQLAGLRTDCLPTAAIASVHLWFDRPVTDLPHAVLLDRVGQWLFAGRAGERLQSSSHRSDEPRPRGPAGAAGSTERRLGLRSPSACAEGEPFYCQVVLSDAGWLVGRDKDVVVARVVDELRQTFPQARAARLLTARVFAERRAVFSPVPHVDQRRPEQRTRLPNLVLAGDWTATGWPSTLEGAVRSGFLAAEQVLSRSGRPARLVQPDLPVSLVTRLLVGAGRC